MNEKQPHLDLVESYKQVFDEARDFLRTSLGEIEFTEPEGGNITRRALQYIEDGEDHEAYELLYSVVEENNLSDIMFLALALTNFDLNYLEAKRI